MISVQCFDKETGQAREALPTEIGALLSQEGLDVWVDVTAPTPKDFQTISENFPFHPLALEDVSNNRHHPKLDEYDDHLFLIVHGVHDDSKPERYKHVQISLFLGRNYLVTFHPPLQNLKQLWARGLKENLLAEGSARLMHKLLDRVVDEFFPLMARIEDRVHFWEEGIAQPRMLSLLEEVFALKRSLAYLRQTVTHQREILQRLTQHNYEVTGEDDRIFFRDIYDHVVRVMDQVEALREIVSAVIEAHVSLSSHRLNEVMKILTILSTIFLPLTFIAGVYGMNFDVMPELRSPFGYPAVLLLMLLIAGGMIYFFRRRGWF